MTRITVCAKVSKDMVERISKTGHRTSDVVQAGLESFLNLPVDKQQLILEEHLIRKKCEKAADIFSGKRFKRRFER